MNICNLHFIEKKQFNSIFGLQIRLNRERKNMTQAELSALMNINFQNISSYERGQRCPSIYWVTKLCQALEVDPNLFLKEFYNNTLLNSNTKI